MRLLLFSDLHTNRNIAHALVEQAQQVDVVIGAGDFCNMGFGLERTIELLQVIDKPTILVPGNSETPANLSHACQQWKSAHVLHGAGVTLNGVDFWGIGGGIPITPFGPWSFDLSEEQAKPLLAGCPSGGVLVSHSPPKGAVDVSSRGQSLGSTAIREIILAQQPRLVVCGHIHASAGQQATIGETVVINAGPSGMVWSLD